MDKNTVAFFKYPDQGSVDVDVNGRVKLTVDFDTKVKVGDTVYLIDEDGNTDVFEGDDSEYINGDEQVTEFYIAGDHTVVLKIS